MNQESSKPMNANLPSTSMAAAPPHSLFASIDMGTNSFKMLILQADPSGKFLTVDRVKEPVVLSRELSTSITTQSQTRAIQSLHKFKRLILSHKVDPNQTRCVATAAVRNADNMKEFVDAIYENVGLRVDVLPGEEEARLVYMGVLQFLPFYDKSVLTIDIGGGSTEFVVGNRGKVKFAISLKLGHVSLTQTYGDKAGMESEMREHIRHVIEESGLVEKLKECGRLDVVVGSSGTIKAVEKAVFHGYAREFGDDNEVFVDGYKRDWSFTKEELSSVVVRLCGGGDGEKVRRDGFFNRRSEFIVAGAILLEEIFEALKIGEMEVSGYALGEGVIAENLAKVYNGYDVNANARWLSISRLATRFNGTKRMKSASRCAKIGKDIFEGLRKSYEHANSQDKLTVSLNDKDIEYLEAACLLHNIGVFIDKKRYHKHSYNIIMNGGHLHGYNDDEMKLIALLARHHRKKFPKSDDASLNELPEELKLKFRILCVVIRISVILQQNKCSDIQDVELLRSNNGFKLVLMEPQGESFRDGFFQLVKRNIETDLDQELKHFKTVFKEELFIET